MSRERDAALHDDEAERDLRERFQSGDYWIVVFSMDLRSRIENAEWPSGGFHGAMSLPGLGFFLLLGVRKDRISRRRLARNLQVPVHPPHRDLLLMAPAGLVIDLSHAVAELLSEK